MKMKKWKRVFSGILAAVTVLSTCMPGSVMASSEEVEVCYPTLEEIINQLDEDEIVRPGDYTVPVGGDLDISLDFTNFNVTDWMKVNIYFDGAYNEDGEYFTTDHADTYRANYHVEPVSGYPVYQVSRNVRVKETEKPKKSTASSTGKQVQGLLPTVQLHRVGEKADTENPIRTKTVEITGFFLSKKMTSFHLGRQSMRKDRRT